MVIYSRERKDRRVRMPVENMEEEGLARIPDLNIAQWIFTCKTNPVRNTFCKISNHTMPYKSPPFLTIAYQDDNETRGKLMGAITEHNMAPLYASVCKVGRRSNTVLIDFCIK